MPLEFGVSLPIHFLSASLLIPLSLLLFATEVSYRLLLALPAVTRQVSCVPIPITVKTAWAEVPVSQTPQAQGLFSNRWGLKF